jgi:hypothetical protein
MKQRALLRKQECSLVTDILSRKKLLSKAAKLEEIKTPVSSAEQARMRVPSPGLMWHGTRPIGSRELMDAPKIPARRGGGVHRRPSRSYRGKSG